MSKSILAIALIATATCCASAFAQEVPLRGVGLLAMNTSDSDNGLGGSSQGLRRVVAEAPDEGDSEPRSGRGSGDTGTAAGGAAMSRTPDTLPANGAPHAETASGGAAAPKRPTYRWQSLVPGAIK